MSLRYSLVLEVLPTQFLVASTATVNILYAFYCNKNQFHGRSIPEGYFQRHLQTSFYSSIVKITFFETTLWLGHNRYNQATGYDTFPHEAIRGRAFSSARGDAFPPSRVAEGHELMGKCITKCWGKGSPENCLMWKRHSPVNPLINWRTFKIRSKF